MNLFRIYILFILLLPALFAASQESWEIDPMPIRLKGQLLNIADKTPIPYAHVVNSRTHGGTITNASGMFTLDMLNIDSLVFSSLGFFKETFSVPYNSHPDSIVSFYLKPVSISIPQVNVTADRPGVNLDGVPRGKPVDIPAELRGDAYNEKPPILSALISPASFLQYHLGKNEIRKRKVREAILTEKKWKLHSKNYNKEIVMSLTGLDEVEAEVFMIWFNSQNVLPYTSTEYEVRAAIKQQFEIYKKIKKE